MTREEKLETLAYWQQFGTKAKALKAQLEVAIGNPQNMPFVEHYDDLFQDYSALVGVLVMDAYEYLEWYAWENDFGERGLEAGLTGEAKPIKTVEDLLDLIEGTV